MKISLALSYDDVLLIPKYSEIQSRSLVDVSTHLTKDIMLKVPFISANMSDVTNVTMAIALGKLGALGVLPRFEDIQKQVEHVKIVKKENILVGAAIGVKDGYLEKARLLIEAGADVLVLDVAHGHTNYVALATKNIKTHFPKSVLVSGNVATYDGAKALFGAGADVVKVGIGPGSICTTRIATGHGVPQLTAVLEASKAAKEYGKTIIADGGIKQTGDVAKALAAGANAVMMGNAFAGTDEAPGEYEEINGVPFKRYNGSTSPQEKYNHTKKISVDSKYTDRIEGVNAAVNYKGPVEHVVEKYKVALQSALSYSGANNLTEFQKNAEFIQITSSGIRESGAHDVIIK